MFFSFHHAQFLTVKYPSKPQSYTKKSIYPNFPPFLSQTAIEKENNKHKKYNGIRVLPALRS
jgi:hypothetical protein